jgi:hypothetical protein
MAPTTRRHRRSHERRSPIARPGRPSTGTRWRQHAAQQRIELAGDVLDETQLHAFNRDIEGVTVVVGGVGSLYGTIFSALGIGMADQSLQQILGNPVLGKILVLVGIILFLQWRPAGLFVTRSRSLEN